MSTQYPENLIEAFREWRDDHHYSTHEVAWCEGARHAARQIRAAGNEAYQDLLPPEELNEKQRLRAEVDSLKLALAEVKEQNTKLRRDQDELQRRADAALAHMKRVEDADKLRRSEYENAPNALAKVNQNISECYNLIDMVQEKGHIGDLTGDGYNDTVALLRAMVTDLRNKAEMFCYAISVEYRLRSALGDRYYIFYRWVRGPRVDEPVSDAAFQIVTTANLYSYTAHGLDGPYTSLSFAEDIFKRRVQRLRELRKGKGSVSRSASSKLCVLASYSASTGKWTVRTEEEVPEDS